MAVIEYCACAPRVIIQVRGRETERKKVRTTSRPNKRKARAASLRRTRRGLRREGGEGGGGEVIVQCRTRRVRGEAAALRMWRFRNASEDYAERAITRERSTLQANFSAGNRCNYRGRRYDSLCYIRSRSVPTAAVVAVVYINALPHRLPPLTARPAELFSCPRPRNARNYTESPSLLIGRRVVRAILRNNADVIVSESSETSRVGAAVDGLLDLSEEFPED